jgi:hypothetical protein
MNKSTFFSGQPVLAQLIKMIPDSLLLQVARRHGSDRYCKRFKSRDHLITMLYACFHGCTSIRELVTGLEASYNKLSHLKLHSCPRRSTLSDANSKRPVEFFEDLYKEIYQTYYKVLPDSRKRGPVEKRLFILDSTTVTLFSDVMKGAGRPKVNGRRKGGVKAHVLLDAKHDVPRLVCLTEGSRNDRIMMPKVNLTRGDYLVFDKGYHHFKQWEEWTTQGISWVTRLNDVEVFEILKEKPVSIPQQQDGVCQDIKILLGRGSGPDTPQITVRLVSYYVDSDKKIYHYLTNNFHILPATAAHLYKQRWQVETFFKRIKQSNPLRYFLGDNENAVRIQLWCAFIKDLLIKVVKDQLLRKWSYANISAMIRHHLMNYLDLKAFLNYPDKLKHYLYPVRNDHQLVLFRT